MKEENYDALPPAKHNDGEGFDLEKGTLPHLHSNLGGRGDSHRAVMWTEPEPLGLGTRSGGQAESTLDSRGAWGVTEAPNATQLGLYGASHAPVDSLTKAQIVSTKDTSAKIVIDTYDIETPSWASWSRHAAEKIAAARINAKANTLHPKPLLALDVCFDIIKVARTLLIEDREKRAFRKDTLPGEATIRDYNKKCKQIDAELDAIEPGCPNPLMVVMGRHAASESSFVAIKSALKYRSLCAIKNLLGEQDKLQRMGLDVHAWQQCVEHLREAVTEYTSIQRLNRTQCLELEGLPKKKKGGASKRHMLPRLPIGWQNTFLKRNASLPTYRLEGVLLRFCGMRPDELAKGVDVSWEGQEVKVRILGAKVRATCGQPERAFVLSAAALPAWFLKEIPLGQSLKVKCKAGALGTHLWRLSNDVFYNRLKNPPTGKNLLKLSAYVFRHSLVNELREAGWTTEEIAAVIGETSAETVRYYGTPARGRARKMTPVAIIKSTVKTALPVRPLDRSGLQHILGKENKLSAKKI